MDQFELVLVSLSIILGLSMGHMLWTAAAVVRHREQLSLDWLPFAWAACIFVQHAHFWFSAFAVNLDIGTWTWSWYLQILTHAVLLFAAGALVLPSEAQLRGSMRSDFEKHGRLSLMPFGAYQLLWFPTNYRADPNAAELAHLFRPGNLANFILIALLMIGFRTKSPAVQAASVVTFALVLAWATTFAWAQNAF